jgi:hypothetical protein
LLQKYVAIDDVIFVLLVEGGAEGKNGFNIFEDVRWEKNNGSKSVVLCVLAEKTIVLVLHV